MAISNEMGSGAVRQHTSQRGMAFLVEALIILAFLMLSLAVFVRLFVGAQLEGIAANRKSEAVLAATNIAEEFSANPTGVATTSEVGDLVVTCDVKPDKREAGTLYNATIVVTHDSEEVYRLQTARYVSGGEVS